MLPLADLRADCARCVGLCCVAPTFGRSSEFAIDKPAGVACPHLQGDFRCGVHDELRPRGFSGCTVFDCFGAGQKVAAGASAPVPELFDAFFAVQSLHEMLWYLTDALSRPAAAALHDDLQAAYDHIVRLSDGDAVAVDIGAEHVRVDGLLTAASARVRAAWHGPDHRGADLAGVRLRGQSLRGASLRSATLLGADLRGADLRCADLLGADLRGADVRGADLSDALFVTQKQVNGARGDAATRLPAAVLRPPYWAAA